MNSEANVILHIGAGSFHRAHQAWYMHWLNETGDTSWSLAVGNIRGDMNAVLEALAAQNGEYTLETVTPQGERAYETVRPIKKVVPWSADLEALVARRRGSEDEDRVLHRHRRRLLPRRTRQARHRQSRLAADLKGGRTTIYGALAAILDARMKNGAGKVALQNCDNLRSNGDRFKKGMLQFLELRGETALRDWMLANTSARTRWSTASCRARRRTSPSA